MYRSDRSRGTPLGGAALTADTWMQRVGGFAGLPMLIRQLGVDPAAALREAGLALDALDRPDRRVPYAALARLLRVAAEKTECAHFGLLAGRMWRTGDLGVLGEIVRNSATVADALEALTVYQHLNSGGGLVFLFERGGMVDLGYAIYHPEVSDTNHLCDAVLAAGLNYLRELCGNGFAPTEVLVPHANSADPTPYRHLFKVQPRFSSELCALRFSASWMQRAIDGADAERRRVALAAAESGPPQEFMQQIYRALRLLLLEGRNSGDEVAQMLSMHRRTLNRRLKAHGTTFQNVLDDVRFSIARQHLATSSLALDDVAEALGYAGVSPFMRTFQRWTGTTPGRWRRAAVANLAYRGDAQALR